MRTVTIRALSTALVIATLASCSSNDKQEPQLQLEIPGPPVTNVEPPGSLAANPCRAAIEYKNELDELQRSYPEDHPDVIRLRELAELAKAGCFAAAGQTFRSGEWVEKDGILVCDGFMTRRADQDYCSADIPEDWVPFTFEGKTYYVQPLVESQ
jgi:hypothetical protein